MGGSTKTGKRRGRQQDDFQARPAKLLKTGASMPILDEPPTTSASIDSSGPESQYKSEPPLGFWLKENDQCKKFQLPANNTNAIVLDPPLPTLIDLPTIFRLFFPSEGMLNEPVSDKTKRSYWHVMESVGDSVILLILRDILLEIFGDRSSLAFLKVVEDHAKGSEFLAQIAKYYNLQHWCTLPPRDIAEW